MNDAALTKEEKLISNKGVDDLMQTTFTSFANAWHIPTTPGTGDTPIRDIRIMYTIGRTSLTVTLTDL